MLCGLLPERRKVQWSEGMGMSQAEREDGGDWGHPQRSTENDFNDRSPFNASGKKGGCFNLDSLLTSHMTLRKSPASAWHLAAVPSAMCQALY